MHRGILSFILLAFSIVSFAVDLSQVDFSYLYNPNSPVRFQYRLASDGETLKVFTKHSSGLTWAFLTQDNFNTTADTPVTPKLIDSTRVENELFVEYQFTLSEVGTYLIFSSTQSDFTYYFPVEVKPDIIPSFFPKEEAVLVENYASSLPTYQSVDALYAYIYAKNFGAADPPFGNMGALSPVLEVDTLLVYDGDVEVLENAFYFIQADTNSSVGSGFLQCPPYFPRYRRIDELISTMQYICSSREFGDMIQSPNPRQAFQDFWIESANGQAGAKRAIRNYFRRVTAANLLFTNYKPGWQTDQGMIFLVYGSPDRVESDGRKETWYYGDTEKFDFIKISTLFAPQLYTLIRDPEYRDSWTQRIKGIRAGL